MDSKQYQYKTQNIDGFLAQLVRYIAAGHYFYVRLRVPEGKDPDVVAQKLLKKYDIKRSRWQRKRRNLKKNAGIRRDAVVKAQEAFGVSERRACHALGQPRSTQRYKPLAKTDEVALISRILELVREFPRYGYRMITRLLRQEGWRINFKRVYRIWRQQGLKVPIKKRKRLRLGDREGGINRRRAERPNHVWSVDFVFDRTRNGRSLKILSLIDEFTRECIALEVNRSFRGENIIDLLAEQFAIRGVPKYLRSDNGPEFISIELRKFLSEIDVGVSFIEPGSPWENGYVESFNSRLRDECLACEVFTTLAEARTVIGEWRRLYNHRRPHGSLDGKTPVEFATQWAVSAPAAPPLQLPTADCVT